MTDLKKLFRLTDQKQRIPGSYKTKQRFQRNPGSFSTGKHPAQNKTATKTMFTSSQELIQPFKDVLQDNLRPTRTSDSNGQVLVPRSNLQQLTDPNTTFAMPGLSDISPKNNGEHRLATENIKPVTWENRHKTAQQNRGLLPKVAPSMWSGGVHKMQDSQYETNSNKLSTNYRPGIMSSQRVINTANEQVFPISM